MQEITSDITIIGGGLTGLTLAYLLKKENVSVKIIESRDRLGGRIYTKYKKDQAPQEMGATWLGKKHTELIGLLEELEIEIFEQVLGETAVYEPISTSPPQIVQLPPNADPSYRISGGSSTLIKALASKLNMEDIFLSQVVKGIEKRASKIIVKTDKMEFYSDRVVSTLPPFLLTESVQFSPHLPDPVVELCQKTHTWMGDSIKVSLSFETPFWRTEQLSGTVFSNVGPIPEMYDHSNVEESAFALKGFLNGAYFSVSKEERLALVLGQLEKYYGSKVRTYTDYNEAVWRLEPFTFAPYHGHVLPHQNNGHPIFQNTFFDGKFFIAGAETAPNFPGYMEGAIQSAQMVVKQLSNNS